MGDASPRVHYEPSRPEKTDLYRIVQENIETFHHQVEMETGQSLPAFVIKEFDATRLHENEEQITRKREKPGQLLQ